ncbi:hypothetical protein HNY73_007867 [Argiope bruennichi]|uniref:Uncharacterized protein n=1 Tax=Argiope bruennichi TaxID=94029 RepID=A0A8T0F4G2_ARGBR|nr:hypothetical protein HNY73_007867 [Argiope bruennichi]
MKSVVVICFLLLVVGVQCRPWLFPWWMLPYYSGIEDEYAASLGGAPVGLYSRRKGGGFFGERSEISGVSLGGAKVGLYGRERPSFLRRWPLLG